MNGPRFLLAALILLLPQSIGAEETREVTREKVEGALPKLEKLAEQTLEKMAAPGMAIAVVYRDEVVYLKGFGVRRAGDSERVDADTRFQIASVSKPITTTVLARLVGEGLIQWDNRIVELDPGFQLFDPWATREVTLRDMLCHRSGLPAQAGDLLEDIGYSRDEILRRLRYLPADSSFRTKHSYTNFGFTEAAVAAAKRAGKPWEELIAEKLYRPLGMTSTSSRYADWESAENRTFLHSRVGDKWLPKHDRQPDAQSPAGGVISTARDLAQWVRLQLGNGQFNGKQLIEAEALGETHQPDILTSYDPVHRRGAFYGLGWGVGSDDQGRAYWRHSGGFDLGMRTQVALLPAEELGIVVLSNSGPNGIPEGMTMSFFDLVLFGKPQQDWIEFANMMFEAEVKRMAGEMTDFSKPPVKKSPAADNASYVGLYRNDYFGDLEVVEGKDSLMMRIGPKKMKFPLRHWDRDVFVYDPTGESATGPSGVMFLLGPDQNGQRVLVEHLNRSGGQGTFLRVE